MAFLFSADYSTTKKTSSLADRSNLWRRPKEKLIYSPLWQTRAVNNGNDCYRITAHTRGQTVFFFWICRKKKVRKEHVGWLSWTVFVSSIKTYGSIHWIQIIYCVYQEFVCEPLLTAAVFNIMRSVTPYNSMDIRDKRSKAGFSCF